MGTVAHAEELQVLHWWESTSEHKAVEVLATRLNEENIAWREVLIPGGSGVGASIVLKSRVLTNDAPEVAQLNGLVTIGEWADLGLLREFDSVAAAGKWSTLLFPMVFELVQPRGHIVAAPVGIHRINTLFYNRKLLAQVNAAPPRNWQEFERVAIKLQQAGIAPLAQSSEPWQVGTLFENLVLAEGGPALFRELFVKKQPDAFSDVRLTQALTRLRSLKQWMATPIRERLWTDVARQFADGNAAMMVMGDFVKGELNAWGYPTDGFFGCTGAPGTDSYHLYDIDTLVMLAKDGSHHAAQERLAQLVISPAIQADYNQIKGSIPVLRSPDWSKMDSCARASSKLFAKGPMAQVPSLAHRMATDEVTKDAIIAEVHRFFMNDQVSVADTQRRLGAIARALTSIKAKN
ncbi:MAG: ABC transporter substrate-binding protein [Pseudomonadota bacterium]|nr:ABC transporter substrate-binding protein [Pseudomonadota bacterium]